MQVHDLREKYDTFTALLDQLKGCQFDSAAFTAHMASFQSVVDDLNLAEYANLPTWVAGLSKKVRNLHVASSPHPFQPAFDCTD